MADPPPPQPDQLKLPSPPPSQQPLKATSLTWGTLEELLLACAVNRHGTNSWESVANELRNRTPSLSISIFSPLLCSQKYLDLKRRFSGGDDDSSVWLEELRRLRVAELKRELHRYDVSIVSLQLKVKKLKEEREKSVKQEDEEDNKSGPPENDAINVKISPGNGDRKNDDSVNESNFTEPKTEPVTEPEISEPDRVDEPVGKAEGRDDSCNGSSNSKEGKPDRVEPGELEESVAESIDGGGEEEKKENSDVQSTASLWETREKKDGSCGGDENQSPASVCKPQALADFMDMVRTCKFGSVFERRLDSQEAPRYKSLIKEHIDLGIIQKRLEEGQYADCRTKFYRDLMLLINNAIIFFAKRSSEHKAAIEFRELVTKHFHSHIYTQKSPTSKSNPPATPPKPTRSSEHKATIEHKADPAEITDLKPKLAITGPVIACRKRSSIAGKLSTSAERKESTLARPPIVRPAAGEALKQQCEKSSSTSFNAVTKKLSRDQNFGSRSSSSKNNSSSNRSTLPSPSPNQKSSPSTPISGKREKSEAKADLKKPSPGSSNKMKRGSESSEDLLLNSFKNSNRRKIVNDRSSGGNVRSDRRKDQGQGSQNGLGSKSSKQRESPGSRSTARPPKRAVAMTSTGKRGREGGGETESQSKKRHRK